MSDKVGLSQACETDLITSSTEDCEDLGHCDAILMLNSQRSFGDIKWLCHLRNATMTDFAAASLYPIAPVPTFSLPSQK